MDRDVSWEEYVVGMGASSGGSDVTVNTGRAGGAFQHKLNNHYNMYTHNT